MTTSSLIARLEAGGQFKAISLWQPWATLWLTGRKIHETRHWPTSHRGVMLVHAAKRKPDTLEGDELDELCYDEFGCNWVHSLPRGAIIGAVDLVDCVRTNSFPVGHLETDDGICGDFCDGRYAWKRGEFVRFHNPIPYRGSQGFFAVSLDAIALLRAKEGE